MSLLGKLTNCNLFLLGIALKRANWAVLELNVKKVLTVNQLGVILIRLLKQQRNVFVTEF
ncbi:hypothetical protein [Vagococcus intermedius]|nr:hypothetical protein [Vagococcus intermedius]WEG75116.1 hypothetical protein OL235_08655 [Vagococcus intermedius]